MKRKPLVACRHCKGKGKVGLSDSLVATLAALGHGAATPPDIFKRMQEAGLQSASIGSANNALERLRELKMATRKKETGVRGFIYSLAKKSK